MERTRVWSLQVAAFAVIAALLAWFARPAPPAVPFADADSIFAAAPPLEESAPLRSASQLRSAVAARRPALWRNSAVRGWAALGNWSAASLADRIPWVLSRSQPRREFVLSTPRRGSAPLLRTVPAWEALSAEPATNLTLAQLLGAAPAGGGAHYGSGTLSEADHATGVFESAAGSTHWRSEELMRDLQPLSPLLLADVPAATPAERAAAAAAGSALPRNRTTLRLWLGGGGVLARTHYDKGHNLFVQLVGRKRVLLWPPSELPALHLYPANHEAFRQSQVPLVREAAAATAGDAAAPPAAAALAARFPLWDAERAATARLAELGPGDLLYIPPYWAHAVLSVDASVSLAAFSDSWEQARWARSGWVAAPFGALQDDACGRVRGAAALILAFAAACGPLLPQPPRAFVGALLASRYAPLDGGGGEAEAAAAAPAACLLSRPLRNDKPRLRAEGALKSAVLSTASAVAALLREPDEAAGGRTFGAAVARELAGDYAEELAGWASGAAGASKLLRLLAGHGEAELAVGHMLERYSTPYGA